MEFTSGPEAIVDAGIAEAVRFRNRDFDRFAGCILPEVQNELVRTRREHARQFAAVIGIVESPRFRWLKHGSVWRVSYRRCRT